MPIKLIIGNPNYSSWSLRPWLLMHAFNIHFTEQLESLQGEDVRERLLKHSPAAKVPVFIERDLVIWDSLAICEYINEIHLEGIGWPRLPMDRAHARALTSEMHSGFAALRAELPMNIRAKRKVTITPALQRDIDRIDAIWSAHHKQGWLFEQFSIADCFYAPVAFRMQTYGIALSPNALAYQEKLLAHPSMQAWHQRALEDTEELAFAELGEPA